MARSIEKNAAFLRNIYAKGPFQGHGFVCTPPQVGFVDHPDYDFTLSDKPVQNWLPQVVENYTASSGTWRPWKMMPSRAPG